MNVITFSNPKRGILYHHHCRLVIFTLHDMNEIKTAARMSSGWGVGRGSGGGEVGTIARGTWGAGSRA